MTRNWWLQPRVSAKGKSKRRRLTIETLEARITPAPAALTYTSPGASSLTLKLSGPDLQIVNGSNTIVASRALTDTTGVVITGADGATDKLLLERCDLERVLAQGFHRGAAVGQAGRPVQVEALPADHRMVAVAKRPSRAAYAR